MTADSMGYFTHDVNGANASAVNSLFTSVTNMLLRFSDDGLLHIFKR